MVIDAYFDSTSEPAGAEVDQEDIKPHSERRSNSESSSVRQKNSASGDEDEDSEEARDTVNDETVRKIKSYGG